MPITWLSLSPAEDKLLVTPIEILEEERRTFGFLTLNTPSCVKRELLAPSVEGMFFGAQWSPNARHVLFARRMEGLRYEVWRADIENGGVERLPLDLGHVRGPGYHPSGDRLAVRTGTVQAERWAMENLLSTASQTAAD